MKNLISSLSLVSLSFSLSLLMLQSSLGRAVDNMADDIVKAGKEVSRDVSNVVYNPIVSPTNSTFRCYPQTLIP